ncbi:protein EARLY FLOWERING [Salix suchowensis]|nr:protein EARLY FLOWERING [Salix suchowensis]
MCMTKLESSSLVEEEQVPTLDNTTGTAIAPPKQYKKGVKDGGGGAKNGEEEEECDVEAWDTLSKSFKQVQSVLDDLDRNRDLIQQVNSNHRSKIPDNLVKNVSLIREINGNISKKEDMEEIQGGLEPEVTKAEVGEWVRKIMKLIASMGGRQSRWVKKMGASGEDERRSKWVEKETKQMKQMGGEGDEANGWRRWETKQMGLGGGC